MRRIFQMCAVPLIALLFCNFAQADIRNIQDNYRLTYTILDSDGASVANQTVTLKVQKASNDQWLDFDDMAFKASGWTNKNITLSEDTTEKMYYYVFDPPASETTAEQYAFLIDNANATYKDHQAVVVNYQVIGSGTSTLNATETAATVWNATLSNYLGNNTTGKKLSEMPTEYDVGP